MTCIVEMFFRVGIALKEDVAVTNVSNKIIGDIVMKWNLVEIEEIDMIIMIDVDHMNILVKVTGGVENVGENMIIKL